MIHQTTLAAPGAKRREKTRRNLVEIFLDDIAAAVVEGPHVQRDEAPQGRMSLCLPHITGIRREGKLRAAKGEAGAPGQERRRKL